MTVYKTEIWKYNFFFQAARVSNTLSLQSRCSNILALLANSAISQPPNGKILSTHALSLDILITGKAFHCLFNNTVCPHFGGQL